MGGCNITYLTYIGTHSVYKKYIHTYIYIIPTAERNTVSYNCILHIYIHAYVHNTHMCRDAEKEMCRRWFVILMQCVLCVCAASERAIFSSIASRIYSRT